MAWIDLAVKDQRERLEQVRRDPELLRAIPRVVAASFGVLPLGRIPGGLELAVAPSCTPAALRALERASGLRLRAVPMHEPLVHVYISRLYLEGQGVNFHTFESPEFLEDPRSDARLLSEKDEGELTVEWEPDPGRLVLLDYSYRTELRSLDHRPPPLGFNAGPLELGFELERDEQGELRAVLEREAPLPPQVAMLARESYAITGLEHSHGWRVHQIAAAPFLIHPTEVQLVALEPSGALRLWVYDHLERVQPGERGRRFELTYYFLSMGQRLRRRLWIEIHALHSVPRERLELRRTPLPWTAEHLRRWLGLPAAAG